MASSPLDAPTTAVSPTDGEVSVTGRRPPHRVLIYTTCYNVIDGVTLTIRKLERAILDSGGSVCILTTNSGLTKNTHLFGLGRNPNRTVVFVDNSVPIPFYSDPNDVENKIHIGFSLSGRTRRKLNEFGPTVVHVTVPDCTGLCVVDYARKRELPLMGTYHSNYVDYMDHYPGLGWLKPIIEGFTQHQYGFYHALYVPTPYVRRNLVSRWELDGITDLGVWGRGVDTRRFHPRHRSEDFRRRVLGASPSHAVVCFVGRLVPEKRTDIFASVVRRLAERGVRYKALVVGAGPCRKMLAALPGTTCVGWKSGRDLAMCYASSDLFLFPSAVETFGNVTLEAAASGLPLVAEAGCSGHLVEDGVNGHAVPAGDGDAFYRATLGLAEDARRRAEFSARSRQFALGLEDEGVVRQMVAEYSRVGEQFYGEYGGRHRNRDAVFQRNPKAFKGGTNPRPLQLWFIERIFICVFRLAWWVLSMYSFLQQVVVVTLSLAVQDRVSLNETAAREQGESPKPKSLETGDEEEGPTKGLKLGEIQMGVTEEGAESEVKQENEKANHRKCCSPARIGDGPQVFAMATAFVDFNAFQWRMQSRAQDAITSIVERCCRPSLPKSSRLSSRSHIPPPPPSLKAQGRVSSHGSTSSSETTADSSLSDSSDSLVCMTRQEEELRGRRKNAVRGRFRRTGSMSSVAIAV